MLFKTLRRLIALLLALPLLLVLLGAALLLWVDDATRKALELVGTDVLDVNVTVEDIDYSLLKRHLELRDLVVDNPPGYRTEALLRLHQGALVVDWRSIRQEPLHIHHLLLDGMEVTVEQHEGRTNLGQVLDRIPSPYDPNYPQTSALHIDVLEIRNVVVRTKLTPIPGDFDILEFKLAPLRLEQVGYGEQMDVVMLYEKILQALYRGILEHVGSSTGGWLQGTGRLIDQVGHLGRDLLDPNDLGGRLQRSLQGLLSPADTE